MGVPAAAVCLWSPAQTMVSIAAIVTQLVIAVRMRECVRGVRVSAAASALNAPVHPD